MTNKTMHRIFQNFIDRLASAGNAEDFADTMAVSAIAFDLPCFAYLSLPSRINDKPRLISTYPSKWTSHYLERRYQQIDLVIVDALRHPEPFQWGIDLPIKRSPAEAQLLEEAARYGIRVDFTIPIHDGRGPIAAMTFARP